ncbi:MAG: ABC transporter permease subunit [Lachnospiraceae bacterium]|nr:ABC transporter permease subunit [Lachnospiraceae bacterium]
MIRITGFELKKILQKKIVWITFVIFLVFQVFITSGAYFIASRYVDGKFLETKADWFKTDRRNSEKLSGRKIDDTLLAEIEESKKYIPEEAGERESYKYLSSDEYNKKVRPYEIINRLVQYMAGGIKNEDKTGVLVQEMLYSNRHKAQEILWDNYKLSKAEKEYWLEEEKELPEVFTYQYAGVYEKIIDMGGCYYICMFITFFIAICITSIFTDEHIRKTDQLILCTKYGRWQSYAAKIMAGCIVTTSATLILFGITLACFTCIYGTGSFSAMVQVVIAPLYPGNISAGKTAIIMVMLLLLSSVVLSIVTMALSELLKSNTGTMAIVIAAGFLLARLVAVPADFKFIGKIWHMIPINLLKADEGFFDLRLWNVFGIKFTLWQMAFVAYTITGVIFFFIGKRKYCKYQAGGR